jgi:hypothetical protein
VVSGGEQIPISAFTINGDTVIEVASQMSDTITFNERVDYSVGNHPYSVFSADLDGDGDYDLAVLNSGSNDVLILKNNGDGTFISAGNCGVGSAPVSVFSTDLDGDGDSDLAVANFYSISGNVSILKNDGEGAFVLAGNYDAGYGPVSICSSDLDGDGDFDLAVANSYSHNVSILMNTGDGAFLSAANYAAGSNPSSVCSADLDGDGDYDLAVANGYSNNVSLLRNNGDGTFLSPSNYAAGSNPYSICSADLDGDGDIDLAAANSASDNVSILMNSGDGVFTLEGSYYVGDTPYSVFAADLDNDGDNDLAFANGASDNITILKNIGGGNFEVAGNFTAGNTPLSVFSADLNGDGYNDLAVANVNSDTVSIYLNAFRRHGDPEVHSYVIDLTIVPSAVASGEYFQIWTALQGYENEFINDFRIVVLNNEGDSIQVIHGPLSVDMSNGFDGVYPCLIENAGDYQIAVQYSPDGGATWLNFGTDEETNNPLAITVDNCIGNRAYLLNGSNQSLSVLDNDVLDIGSSDFSIEAWIKMESIRNQCIIDKSASNGGYRLELGHGNIDGSDLVIMYRNLSGQFTEFRVVNIFSAADIGRYHHIAVAVNTGVPSARMYLDGFPRYVTVSADDAATVAPAHADLHIGTTGSLQERFHGAIDEVRISNIARVDSEILNNYASGNEMILDANTIALWHMNGAKGTYEKVDNAEGTSAMDLIATNDPIATVGFNECDNLTPTELVPVIAPGLKGAYPNPFNPCTTIIFGLAYKQHVALSIYDVSGRLITVLANDIFDKGVHEIIWKGLNDQDRPMSSGVYFCRLTAGSFTETKKLVLLR